MNSPRGTWTFAAEVLLDVVIEVCRLEDRPHNTLDEAAELMRGKRGRIKSSDRRQLEELLIVPPTKDEPDHAVQLLRMAIVGERNASWLWFEQDLLRELYDIPKLGTLT